MAPATACASDHLEMRAHVRRQRLRAHLLALPAQSARRVVGAHAQLAPECAAQRIGSGLTALRATELLISCREARWLSVLCVVCGSHGGHVVRRSLLSICPGAPTPGRLLALREVLLRFLSGSKRTARLDSIPVEVLRAQPDPCRTRGPFLAFLPSSLFVAAALRDVLTSLRLTSPSSAFPSASV